MIFPFSFWQKPAAYDPNLVLLIDTDSYNSDTGEVINLVDNVPLTLEGTTEWQNFNLGIVNLDGNSDYITVESDGFGTRYATQEFTINIWCRLDIDNIDRYEGIWSYDFTNHLTPYYAQHLRFDRNNNTWYFLTGNATTRAVTYQHLDFVPGTWYCLTATFLSSGKQIFYIDGVEVVEKDSGGEITYYNQEVWIGRLNFASGYMGGATGTTRFYDRQLSADEVLYLYNLDAPRYAE